MPKITVKNFQAISSNTAVELHFPKLQNPKNATTVSVNLLIEIRLVKFQNRKRTTLNVSPPTLALTLKPYISQGGQTYINFIVTN